MTAIGRNVGVGAGLFGRIALWLRPSNLVLGGVALLAGWLVFR